MNQKFQQVRKLSAIALAIGALYGFAGSAAAQYVSNVSQSGADNDASVLQQNYFGGLQTVTIDQNGNGNNATAEQLNSGQSSQTILQNGDANDGRILQFRQAGASAAINQVCSM